MLYHYMILLLFWVPPIIDCHEKMTKDCVNIYTHVSNLIYDTHRVLKSHRPYTQGSQVSHTLHTGFSGITYPTHRALKSHTLHTGFSSLTYSTHRVFKSHPIHRIFKSHPIHRVFKSHPTHMALKSHIPTHMALKSHIPTQCSQVTHTLHTGLLTLTPYTQGSQVSCTLHTQGSQVSHTLYPGLSSRTPPTHKALKSHTSYTQCSQIRHLHTKLSSLTLHTAIKSHQFTLDSSIVHIGASSLMHLVCIIFLWLP